MPRSVIRSPALSRPRKVKDVPFVELFGQRLQGVVSSGSDVERVYVSFFEAGTMNYSCSTNNNRPCGGLRGSPCKHLHSLRSEAELQFGAERVNHFLSGGADAQATGMQVKQEAGMVFSRFLAYLRYLELEGSTQPVPEMAFFVSE